MLIYILYLMLRYEFMCDFRDLNVTRDVIIAELCARTNKLFTFVRGIYNL